MPCTHLFQFCITIINLVRTVTEQNIYNMNRNLWDQVLQTYKPTQSCLTWLHTFKPCHVWSYIHYARQTLLQCYQCNKRTMFQKLWHSLHLSYSYISCLDLKPVSHIKYSYMFKNLSIWNSWDCRTLHVQTSKSLNSIQYFIALNMVISFGVLHHSKIWNCCREKMTEHIALYISHSSMQTFISRTDNTHSQTFQLIPGCPWPNQSLATMAQCDPWSIP